MERKIATSVQVRINVGNYQHIELTKYAEEKIEFSNDEERINAENKLQDELVNDLIRSMRNIPERLGKKTDAVSVVEEQIEKVVPEWLEADPVPNIAKDTHNKSNAEQKSKEIEQQNEVEALLDEAPVEGEMEVVDAVGDGDDFDLFE